MAVTISLMLSGNCAFIQGLANVVAQLLGSVVAAGMLWGVIPNGGNSSLGSNIREQGCGALGLGLAWPGLGRWQQRRVHKRRPAGQPVNASCPRTPSLPPPLHAVSPGFSRGEALLGEAIMTCFLCYVVHMTAVDVRSVGNKGFAPIAIGFTVLLGHAVLLPVDGCSINPSRSFGPAAISGTWDNFWIFVAGPIIGGIIAGVRCTPAGSSALVWCNQRARMHRCWMRAAAPP